MPPSKRMMNDPSGLPAFYGNTGSSLACEHTWSRQRQEPDQLPAVSFLSSHQPE